MSTAVVLHHPITAPMPQPDFKWLIHVSELLAKSTLVPGAYRNKPENVLLASLAGQAYGWDPTMAMRSFHVIDGQPSMKPEIMLALVRRAGHSVHGETSANGATVTGVRRDTGDTISVQYTLEDARRANLLNKDNWKKYPHNMCWSRATSQLCRMLFQDVVLGAGYTPEELGATVNADGEVIETTEAPTALNPDGHIASAEAKRTLVAMCGGDVARAKALWGDRGSASMPPEELEALLAKSESQSEDADTSLTETVSKNELDHNTTLVNVETECSY